MHKSFSLVFEFSSFSRTLKKLKVVVTGNLQSSALIKTTKLTVQFVHPWKTSNTSMFPHTSYKTVVLTYIHGYKLPAKYPHTQSPQRYWLHTYNQMRVQSRGKTNQHYRIQDEKPTSTCFLNCSSRRGRLRNQRPKKQSTQTPMRTTSNPHPT